MSARNLLITVEYDGTRYGGWQTQHNAPSIQAAIETAIFDVTGESVHVQGAGRTDSGVHAEGQAANFHTRSTIPVADFPSALNARLPVDIAVIAAREVPADFHAQYTALGKAYRYRILNRRTRTALARDRVWLVRRPLDPEAMQRGARHLVGRHDFRAFAVKVPTDKDSVRTVRFVDLSVRPPYLDVNIGGDGFLYRMVRTMVGTLVRVGLGELAPDAVADIRDSRDRRRAGTTAPAAGLCLVEVWYP